MVFWLTNPLYFVLLAFSAVWGILCEVFWQTFSLLDTRPPRPMARARPMLRAECLAELMLPGDATAHQIRHAWCTLSRFEDPAAHPDDPAAAKGRLVRVQRAYEALGEQDAAANHSSDRQFARWGFA